MENGFLQKVTEAIEDNLGNSSFGAAELAHLTGMSHSSLLRKIRKLTGKSINQFIREIRLKRAWELLQDESLTVSEVAFRTGFSSPSYFSSVFHEFFGYSPVEARSLRMADKEPAPIPQVITAIKRRKKQLVVSLSAFAFILVSATVIILLTSSGKLREERSIAVLPFQSLRPDTLNLVFAEGFRTQVIMALEKIKVFQVRSDISADQYKNTDKQAPEIGRELDATYFLEGRVGLDGEKVKVWVQLIDAATDKHFWSDDFTCKIGSTFELLDSIAQFVAYQLHTNLLPRESSKIQQRCTKSTEAWLAFLQGNALMSTARGYAPEQALPYRRKTVELDSTWADAYLALAQTLNMLMIDEPRQEYLDESIKAVMKANELRPGADTYLPLARHFLGLGEYEKAWEYYNLAYRDKPDDRNVNYFMGLACMRFGKWKRAEKLMFRAHEILPNNIDAIYNLGQIFEHNRDFSSAVQWLNQIVSLNPDWTLSHLNLSGIALKSRGDTEEARNIIEHANRKNPWIGWNASQALYQYVVIDIYEGKYQEALDELAKWFGITHTPPPDYFRPKYLFYAMIYGYLKKPDLEKTYYDSTRIYIEDQLEKFAPLRNKPTLYSCLGIAWAGLGNLEKSQEMTEKVIQLLSDRHDAFREPYALEDVAYIYTKNGDYTKALKLLRRLLSKPGPLTTRILELDPRWEPLRNLPGYGRMLDQYSVN